MKFKNGLQEGAEGGHGPIRYKITGYRPAGFVEFVFQQPAGFQGIHFFEIIEKGRFESAGFRQLIRVQIRPGKKASA